MAPPQAASGGISKLDAAREEGNRLVAKREYALACDKYTEALKLNPRHAKIYSNRSFALFKMGRYALAKQDAEKAIDYEPEWNKGYFRLGEVLATTENFGRAEAIYAKGLSLDPTDRLMRTRHKDAATAYAKQRDSEEREPMIYCGVALVLAVGILYGDAHTKTPMLDSNVAYGITFILVIAIALGLTKLKQMYVDMRRKSYLIQADLSPNFAKAAHSPNYPGGPTQTQEAMAPGAQPADSAPAEKKRRQFRKVPKKPPGVGVRGKAGTTSA